MTAPAGGTAPMFTGEAWEAGWQAAERAGLAQSFQPLMRPISRDDIAAIVSAVVSHGFTEMHIDAMISDFEVDRAVADPMESLRESMRNRLAMLVLREQCVMLTLPREIAERHEPGITSVRLIVPVRRVRQ